MRIRSQICYAPDDGAAGGAPAPAAPAPSGTDNSSGIDHSSEAARIFEFDAFGPDNGGLPQGNGVASDGQGVTPKSNQVQPAQAPAPSAEPPAQAPAAPQQSPAAPAAPAPGVAQATGQMSPEEAALLRQQVSDMRTALEVARGGQGQVQGQQPQGQDQGPTVDVPAYQYNIPEQLGNMLTSENPQERLAATSALITGASRVVHDQVIRAIRNEMGQVLPHIINSIVQQHSQEQAVFRDFYGTFKELNRPELRTLVREVGKQVSAEFGNPGWTPQLRDAIGTRVKAILSGASPAPQMMQPTLQPSAPTVPVTPSAPAQPPHMTGTTSRPAPATLPGQQADMLDLLNFR